MLETIVFCFVFLSQVLLISWFHPKRVIDRTRYVLKNFPPSTHPRMYPQPPEAYERWLRNIARVHFVIVTAGLLIIGLILATLVGGWEGIFSASQKKHWDETFIAPFFMVQILAGVGYLQISASKLLCAMKKAPPPRVRTAELHRRGLLDFVSPGILVVAALVNAGFIAFVLYSYQYSGLPRFKAVVSITCVLLTILAFSLSVVATLRARRLDPYQAQQDRHRTLKRVVQQAVGYCIAFPLLFAIVLTFRSYQPVMVSLFMQGIALALLWPSFTNRLEEYDFDVYRQDPADLASGANVRINSL